MPHGPANAPLRVEFYALFQRYQGVYFDARVTGDSSLFPTIFYNDPAEKLHPEYVELMRQYEDQVATALANAAHGPVGALTGFLSANIAAIA